MRTSATTEFLPRLRLVVIVALVSQLVHQRSAMAQQTPAPGCSIPAFADDICANIPDDSDLSIDDYKACYGRLYDESIIPAFRAMAQCTHEKAAHGIHAVLEEAATTTLLGVTAAICSIANTVSPGTVCRRPAGESPTNGFNTCASNLNLIDEALGHYIEAERNARSVDDYRRDTYTPALLTYFTNLILAARQNRADCDIMLRSIRKSLVLLGELRVSHPDYCEILRDSADYEAVSRIGALAEWTRIDPQIDFDHIFDVEITLNASCGYYEFDEGGGLSIGHTPCVEHSAQYSQTIAQVGGPIGWLADHRAHISMFGTPIMISLLTKAGWTAPGWYGALIVAGVVLVISAIQAIMIWLDKKELEDLIDEKEEQLRDVVQWNTITEDEFQEMVERTCSVWQPVVQGRFERLLADLDTSTHIANIDRFFALSDRLHHWYNELILWATTPGHNGERFITELARQELLAQKHAFDQRIFGARADQEVAAVRNELTAIKGEVMLLGCSNLSSAERRTRKRQINVGVSRFNATCSSVMSAVAAQPDHPIAFADDDAEHTVVCSYRGFRDGIASLEVRNGEGFTSNMAIKDGTGALVAQLSNVSSHTDFSQAGLPGFSCASSIGGVFGITAATRLSEANYALRLQDTLYGFDDTDVSGLRSTIQSLDSQFRLKQSVCMRQMGAPVVIPRTAEACGLPAVQ